MEANLVTSSYRGYELYTVMNMETAQTITSVFKNGNLFFSINSGVRKSSYEKAVDRIDSFLHSKKLIK